VARFESTFGGQLVRALLPGDDEYGSEATAAIVLRPNSPSPSTADIDGALFLILMPPPKLAAPRIPFATPGLNLHLPGDIAQLTGASAVHRQRTALGRPATGEGVTVAVVDSGFATHRYFTDHAYTIQRKAAWDSADPASDPSVHGTWVLANLLACAPDVSAVAIKHNQIDIGFEAALFHPGVAVISLSWYYEVDPGVEWPDYLWSLHVMIRFAVENLNIVVVVAAGNGEAQTFPASMEQVIAVGGVSVDTIDDLSVWVDSSAYVGTFKRGRRVPDVCGIAASMLLPAGVTSTHPEGWRDKEGATSAATAQVAGVAALLMQKDPTQTPAQIRALLKNKATDIVLGATAGGVAAHSGHDLATGGGLVNALKSWNAI
jgi:subtilisin family serine protease